MPAQIIDGRAVARRVRGVIAQEVAALKETHGLVPGLAVILAGDDRASATYVRNKERASGRVGIEGRTIRLPASVSAEEVARQIDALNRDPAVHGILVQLPLPAGIDGATTRRLLDRIDPAKDVDGLHPINLGRLLAGVPGFVPCTPTGCMRLIEEAGVDPKGKRAAIVGRSTIVGKPMGLLLLAAHATVTYCHSRTQALDEIVRAADIVVAAVGRPALIRGDWIKPGACVIDVGINRDEAGKLIGDVAFAEVVEVAGAVTPVPGGVGPMTITYLLENVRRAAIGSLSR